MNEVIDHFDKDAYLEELQKCGDRRTSAEALKEINELYFDISKDRRRDIKENGLGRGDLGRIMQYKLARGKFRPRLQQMIESNSEELCRSCTKRAFAYDSMKRDDLPDAIKALIELKAVGPATATLILTIVYETVPFFSDEFAAFYHDAPSKYTLKEYLSIYDSHQKEGLQSAREAEQMSWFWARTNQERPRKKR